MNANINTNATVTETPLSCAPSDVVE
jgi:hypothetical protein